MSLMHDVATRALHRLDPEMAHRLTIAALKAGLGPKPPQTPTPDLAVDLAGLRLTNAIGLAAGFDKNAETPDAMLATGFGFVECGTVTPLPQPGNPTPRLFRLTEDRGVINRLGFNNGGLDPYAARLAARPRRGIVGANVGANKDATDRIGDYVNGLARLWPLADYFTINISSPNTPGLRDLQGGEALKALLGRVTEARRSLEQQGGRRPVFLKVAPDLKLVEIEQITEAAIAHGLDALIVGNTTLSRPARLLSPHAMEAGGLSGAPLMDLSTRVLGQFRQAARGRIALIGVGGVASGADAYAKIRAGASAVQLYTAMIYQGPGIVVHIKRDLSTRLRADGFASIAEAAAAA
jgi:dihydroorotate dehydrogenase